MSGPEGNDTNPQNSMSEPPEIDLEKIKRDAEELSRRIDSGDPEAIKEWEGFERSARMANAAAKAGVDLEDGLEPDGTLKPRHLQLVKDGEEAGSTGDTTMPTTTRPEQTTTIPTTSPTTIPPTTQPLQTPTTTTPPTTDPR